MPRGQQKGNREVKKPKKAKLAPVQKTAENRGIKDSVLNPKKPK